MGFAHHSNYAIFYENARWEALNEMGFNYKIRKFDFIRPALYDGLLAVKTMIHEIPGAWIKFEYELFNQSGVLINIAEITLAFIRKETQKPCLPPEYFTKTLQELLLINN